MLFCLKNANILKLSENELDVVCEKFSISEVDTQSALSSLTKKFSNLKIIVLTIGENGAFAYEKQSDNMDFCSAVKTTVVSTVGAGDAFGAVFLAEYLKGEESKVCLQRASARSALVVASKEAIPPIV